ncbi:hypothetical protein [Sulfobacillus thermosulfidooxidans]|uniref:hypothetical protein n=1 Tax=Sulfobacillus thermosulfidooxidans TaxID=28034 RepID=UPI0002DC8F9D|nr:hypothetical protein [Sulfobacillus thermosulfidooxidans]
MVQWIRRWGLSVVVLGVLGGGYWLFARHVTPMLQASQHRHGTLWYPASVAAGPPAAPTSMLFPSRSGGGQTTILTLPTGGLAAPDGRAARWALGAQGALVLFINPANPWDAQEVKDALVPVASKEHMALDVVDTVAVTQVASLPAANAEPPGPSSTIIGQSTTPQTLAQMGITVTKAAHTWQLPSWVHLYVVAPPTLKAWQISLTQDPTLWVVVLPSNGGVPMVGGFAPYNVSSAAQNMTFVQQVLSGAVGPS